jgi:lipoyl(octanoyl) transferase
MNELQSDRRVVRLIQAELVEYQTAWDWQRQLARQRSAGEIEDTVLLLQHPHTYTMGRATKDGHLLVDASTLEAQGVALIASDRGGDITYHGPGQIVGYPILKLSRHGGDVGRYLRLLEETIILTLASYGITGSRTPGLTGVWVGMEKIAAIGVKLSASGVTQHGFALNVTTDLRYFQQIIPCGIVGRGVTSLEVLLGYAPPRAEVEARLIAMFEQVFDIQVVPAHESLFADVVN